MDIYGLGQIAMMAIFDYLEENNISTKRFIDEFTPVEGRRMFADGLADTLGNRTYMAESRGDRIPRRLADPIASGKWIGKRLAASHSTWREMKNTIDAVAEDLDEGNDENVKDFIYGLIKGYNDKCLEMERREEMQDKE